VVAQIVAGQLRSASGGTLQLLATDNSGLSYIGQTGFFYWSVSLVVAGQALPSWSFFLPHTPSPVDLFALANTAAGGGSGGITPPAGDIGGTTSSPTVVSTHLASPLPLAQGGTGQNAANAAALLAALGGAAVAGDLGGTSASPQVVSAHLASPLPLAQGGTGQASASAALAALGGAALAGAAFTGEVTVQAPVNPSDAVTKSYADAIAQGLSIKPSVQEATAAALPSNTYANGASGVGATLTATANGALTVDGIAVAVSDRVLVQNEATASHNGIYQVTATGSGSAPYVLTRTADMNTASQVPGAFVFCEQGTVNAGAGFTVASAGPFTIGTTAITWTQFSGAGEVAAGHGLSKAGNQLSLATPVAAGDLPAATTGTQGAVVLDGTASDIQPDGVAAAGAKGQAADAKHVHPLQPWQFLPEAYGAKGDGKVIGDVVTNSTTTITSATANFTSADVGKHIMIHGANGSSSGPLITTISSVTNSTTAVLASAAGASVSNCPAVYGTDDTAAVASAVTAAGNFALGTSGSGAGFGGYFAEVIFGAKIYVLASGPTQTGNGSTTPTFNAQIPLPYPAPAGTSQKLVIALTGAGDAGFTQYWGSTIPDLAGTCLVSMLAAGNTPDPTFGQQCVIGGPSSAAGFASINGNQAFANVKAVVKGISVWLPIWTNIYAYDFMFLSQMAVRQSSAHIFALTGVNGGPQPYISNLGSALQNSSGTGFRGPTNQNNDDVVMDDVTAQGYNCGFRLNDHFTASRMAAIYHDVAVYLMPIGGVNHMVSIQSLSAEGYNGGIKVGGSGGTMQADIRMDAENASVAYDIQDDNNQLRGVIRFRDPADGRFPVVQGAADVKIICDELGPGYWPGAPSVPSSGTGQQNTSWRDAWVVITGGTVSAVAVDGQATGFTLSTGQAAAVRVPAGKTIAVTYSVAPTWKWWLD
jgi:hypothetical protein